MATVANLLAAKGHELWSVAPDDSVYDAIQRMADKNIGALLVLDGEKLAGIISERDYARKVILEGKSSRDTPVREIMTARVYYVRKDQTIDDCMSLMTERHIRHLPVMDGERPVGMISIGDVVRSIIEDHKTTIKHLENYITGAR